jgi:hypothetical protein
MITGIRMVTGIRMGLCRRRRDLHRPLKASPAADDAGKADEPTLQDSI